MCVCVCVCVCVCARARVRARVCVQTLVQKYSISVDEQICHLLNYNKGDGFWL